MENASAIAERLERDLVRLMARLQSLAGEIGEHIHQAGPRERVDDLHRLGRELAVCLQRLREPDPAGGDSRMRRRPAADSNVGDPNARSG